MELQQASRQWASRPSDERFTSLYDMQRHFSGLKENSKELVLSSRRLMAVPKDDNKGLVVVSNDNEYNPTNWPSGNWRNWRKHRPGICAPCLRTSRPTASTTVCNTSVTSRMSAFCSTRTAALRCCVRPPARVTGASGTSTS